MNASAAYAHHYRDADLVQYTADELVERYRAGKSLTRRQALDAERIIRFKEQG